MAYSFLRIGAPNLHLVIQEWQNGEWRSVGRVPILEIEVGT